ncbi:MAG: YbhB/YbcL family Raf kinase inhibitor-like protein [Methanolobus sp.]
MSGVKLLTIARRNVKQNHPLFLIVLLIVICLSFSGCIETDDEQPDELPDVYESDDTGESMPDPEEANGVEVSMTELTVTSTAFGNGEQIPSKYTCDGENVNPSLETGNIPDDLVSLLLIMDDPDAPSGTFTHWVVWNIEPETEIAENSIPGIEGLNGASRASYTGPCPPSGTHRYFFKMYGLDTELDI